MTARSTKWTATRTPRGHSGSGPTHLALVPLAAAPPSLAAIGWYFAALGLLMIVLLVASLHPHARRLAHAHALHFTGGIIACTFLIAGGLLAAIHVAGGGAP